MSILDFLSRAFGVSPAQAMFMVPREPPPAMGNEEGLLPWTPPAPVQAPAPRIGFMPRQAPEVMGPPAPSGPPADGMHLIGNAIRQGLVGGVPGPSTGMGAFVDQNFGAQSPAMRLVGALAGAPPQTKDVPPPQGGTKSFGLPAGLFDPSGGARTTETIIAPAPRPEPEPPGYRKSDLKNAIRSSAARLGLTPEEFGGMVSYETGGTFNPWQAGPKDSYGVPRRGLIQMGTDERKRYGYNEGDPIEAQLAAVERYMLDRGYKPGMGLAEAYSTINAGAPGKLHLTDENNGGAPGTVADKVRNQIPAHIAKARAFLDGDEGSPMPRAQPGYAPQLPGAPQIQAPQLPGAPRQIAPQYGAAPTLEAPPVRDLSQAREYLKGARPTYREGPGPEENFFRIMANLGGGADTRGGIGSALLGAAGSAGGAMTKYIDRERDRKDDFDTRQLPGWMTNMANFERAAAGDIQADQAAVVGTRNTNAINRDSRTNKQIDANVNAANKSAGDEFDVAVKQLGLNFDADKSNAQAADQRLLAQVRLDADVKNADIQQKNQEEITRWKLSLPDVKPTKDGYMVTTLDPESGRQRIVTHTRENFNSSIDELVKLRKLGGGLGDQEYYMKLARAGGEPALRRAIVDDMIDRGGLKDVIGEANYKTWLAEAKKSFPPEMAADPKNKENLDKRLNDIVLEKMGRGEIPDTAWIPKMASQGNAGARLLMLGGTK